MLKWAIKFNWRHATSPLIHWLPEKCPCNIKFQGPYIETCRYWKYRKLPQRRFTPNFASRLAKCF
jgi:hypothetical protein